MNRLKKFLLIVFFGGSAFFGLFLILLNLPGSQSEKTPVFGVSFTPAYATSLDLNWQAAYTAMLDDLGVRHFRLSAQWDTIEPIDNTYSLDDLDFQMDEAMRRGAEVLLGVGRKLPRWPECHDPAWAKGLTKKERREKILENVRVVVERYKDHPALKRWQVENEVLFPFGVCPDGFDIALLKKEIELVRSLDDRHEIVMTDSGEWTFWIPIAFYGDVLGISMYREAWNELLNMHIQFPINEGWYQLRSRLVAPWKESIIVTELQTEPWAGKAIKDMAPEESLKWMPLEKIQENIRFAKNVGLSEVYLWGAEWWYFLRQQGYPEIWNGLKEVFIGQQK
ncbi:hypothetical protein HY623_00210 [Candidatus Uhrbacteria bacterium]|nr:hypothetical protein [Candidatus Uhrbacteria bacterium]